MKHFVISEFILTKDHCTTCSLWDFSHETYSIYIRKPSTKFPCQRVFVWEIFCFCFVFGGFFYKVMSSYYNSVPLLHNPTMRKSRHSHTYVIEQSLKRCIIYKYPKVPCFLSRSFRAYVQLETVCLRYTFLSVYF